MRSVKKARLLLALTICAVMMSLPAARSVALPITFDCTAKTIKEDLRYAAENGRLSAHMAVNGTVLVFADSNPSPKWLFYKGEFDLNSHIYKMANLTDVRRTVLDFAYTFADKRYCLRLSL